MTIVFIIITIIVVIAAALIIAWFYGALPGASKSLNACKWKCSNEIIPKYDDEGSRIEGQFEDIKSCSAVNQQLGEDKYMRTAGECSGGAECCASLGT